LRMLGGEQPHSVRDCGRKACEREGSHVSAPRRRALHVWTQVCL